MPAMLRKRLHHKRRIDTIEKETIHFRRHITNCMASKEHTHYNYITIKHTLAPEKWRYIDHAEFGVLALLEHEKELSSDDIASE